MARNTRIAGTLLLAAALAGPTLAQEGPEERGDPARITTPDMAPSEPPTLPERVRPGSGQRVAPPSVLAILAHPDDEITFAPVLARIAREGGTVAIAFATSGNAGPGLSGMEPGAALAAVREDEARCAAFALGLPEPAFWQLDDGRLATSARRSDSAAMALRAKIAELIAEADPRVVMTWGPDGGYGHADHRMVSALVTQVVQAMGENRPELLYSVLPANEDSPTELADWAKTHPSLVTDRIAYQPVDLEATRGAVDCYETQFGEQARAYLPDLLHRGVWQGQVHFRLAFPATR